MKYLFVETLNNDRNYKCLLNLVSDKFSDSVVNGSIDILNNFLRENIFRDDNNLYTNINYLILQIPKIRELQKKIINSMIVVHSLLKNDYPDILRKVIPDVPVKSKNLLFFSKCLSCLYKSNNNIIKIPSVVLRLFSGNRELITCSLNNFYNSNFNNIFQIILDELKIKLDYHGDNILEDITIINELVENINYYFEILKIWESVCKEIYSQKKIALENIGKLFNQYILNDLFNSTFDKLIIGYEDLYDYISYKYNCFMSENLKKDVIDIINKNISNISNINNGDMTLGSLKVQIYKIFNELHKLLLEKSFLTLGLKEQFNIDKNMFNTNLYDFNKIKDYYSKLLKIEIHNWSSDAVLLYIKLKELLLIFITIIDDINNIINLYNIIVHKYDIVFEIQHAASLCSVNFIYKEI